MSIYIDSANSHLFVIPQTKVSVLHEVEIVWPDNEVQRVEHAEDVTDLFRDPANRDRHALLVRMLMQSRVNTRLDFGRVVEKKPDVQPPPSKKKWGWLGWPTFSK